MGRDGIYIFATFKFGRMIFRPIESIHNLSEKRIHRRVGKIDRKSTRLIGIVPCVNLSNDFASKRLVVRIVRDYTDITVI